MTYQYKFYEDIHIFHFDGKSFHFVLRDYEPDFVLTKMETRKPLLAVHAFPVSESRPQEASKARASHRLTPRRSRAQRRDDDWHLVSRLQAGQAA